MFVVKYRKIFYTLSTLLVLFSIFSIANWGLNYGIDFKGGTMIEVEYKGVRPAHDDVISIVKNAGVTSEIVVRPTGDKGYIIRTADLASSTITSVTNSLLSAGVSPSSSTSTVAASVSSTSTSSTSTGAVSGAVIKRLDTVGPILGQELQSKSITSIILVILAIVLFITFAFRHVSKPVSSWKYGLAAIIALAHDVLVPTGIYVFLGRNGGYEVDALFVTALLVILGFSVHDTIVVFDRTRENLKIDDHHKEAFDKTVGKSISQTFARSINTSLTTILALIALFIFGADATRNFSLILIIGIVLGTYSSIFLGSPLLVTFWKSQKNK
ncbi:MAG: protein translocase subunit SecF [bacterium]